MDGASEPRNLRIWIKAFIEFLPQILLDFKDTELVDLLLFDLPWLCHGKIKEKINSETVSPKQISDKFHLGPSLVHGN